MVKNKKKLGIILILILLIVMVTTNIFAVVDINKIKDDNNSVGGSTEIKKIGSIILSGITSVGIVLAVVVVAVLGVKYMMGSADERAEYKKSMMPYLIGALLVFGASTIANAVINLVS